MSKAIYGHLGTSDAMLVAEVARLRRRVRELEDQVAAYEAAALADLTGIPADLAGLEALAPLADVDVAAHDLPAPV